MNLKRMFLILILLLVTNCIARVDYSRIEPQNIYSIHRVLNVSVVSNDLFVKESTRTSVSKWNRFLGKEVFNYESSFLSSSRFEYLVLVFDGSEQSRCLERQDVLAYTIAHVDSKDGHTKGGRIFLCRNQILFNKMIGKEITLEGVIVHELGHILSTGHFKESNVLHPYKTFIYPSYFDNHVLIPAIKDKIKF